jgi:UDP-GlcNAc:undecaprenyl-phosphate GlcNAc-1-phosphate transferase
MIYASVFLLALITAVALTPLARRLSFRWGIVAKPGGRRLHHGDIPKLGGIPIFFAYLAAVALIYYLIPPETPEDALRLRGVLLGTTILFGCGMLDDKFDLKPAWQFAFQFLGAAVAMWHIIFIERFTNPFPAGDIWSLPIIDWFFIFEDPLVIIWRPLVFLITLVWVVGMINAVNFLDGLDGLAAGVGTIAMLLFAWHSYRLGQTTVPLFPLAFAAALIGFLFYNFAPASIFLGTAGAWIIGYNLATLSILSPAKLSTALLVMAVPILDVVWQVVSRIRRGQHPFQGDRGHLHFRLSDGGLPTRVIVLGYYAVALGFGLVAIFVPTGLPKLILLGLLVTAVLLILAFLSRRTTQHPQ